jgi:hypothetical protein
MKIATVVLALLLCTGLALAAGYEVPQNRSAKEILPSSMLVGPNYRIGDVVVADGYMHRWTVTSPFGAFETEGDSALRKLLNEIRAIAELQKVRKSESFVKGVGGAMKAPLSLTKSLITHPVDTVSGIPKGAYALMEDVGTSATTTKDPNEDSRMAQALKMSSFKRDIAARLEVDPYTTNKVLQKEMNSVAWAATAGDWAFSAAMLPAGVGGTVVSNVRLTNSIKNVVQQEPSSRLRRLNDEKLEAMGISEDLRKKYLDHPSYSPRHDTILTQNLEALSGVAGRDAFLTLALSAEDEAEAQFYTQMIQILRGYHQTVAKLTAIKPVNRFTVAQTAAGPVVIALPVDRLVWAERVDASAQRLKAEYQGTKIDLWLTGTASPRAKQELESRGVAVTERVSTRVEVLD